MTLLKIFFAFAFAIFMYLSYGDLHNKENKTTLTQEQKIQNAKVLKLKKNVVSTMMTLKSTLENIKDVSSAKAAVGTLEEINIQLDHYLDEMREIPLEDKLQIKKYVMKFIPHLKEPLIKIREIKGAAPVIDASIDKIDTNLMFYKDM